MREITLPENVNEITLTIDPVDALLQREPRLNCYSRAQLERIIQNLVTRLVVVGTLEGRIDGE